MDATGKTVGGKYMADGPLRAAEKRLTLTSTLVAKAKKDILRQSKCDLVFPTIPNGPRCKYIESKPWCPTSAIGLRMKCLEALDNSNSPIVMKYSDIIHTIRREVNSNGFNLNLLPWTLFDLIGEIEIDTKNLHSFLSGREDAISSIISHCWEDDKDDTMNVLKREDYYQYMRHMVDNNMIMNDPLTSSDPSEWTRRLFVDGLDRKFLHFSAGQYVLSKNMWNIKSSHLLRTFRKFETLTINDDSPIEVNMIVRLQTASVSFNYDYTIERISDRRYIRVPKCLRKSIVDFIGECNGMCSLNKLVKHIRDTYHIVDGYYSKIIWLLRFISDKVEDLTIDQHQLIFARNVSEKGDKQTLQGDSLDFTEENLGRYFWRSLTSLEHHFDADLTKYEDDDQRMKTFSKNIIVCFPFGCDMGHVENRNMMCPHRYATPVHVVRHIRSHHNISRHDEEIVQNVIQNRDLINFVKNESTLI